MLMNSDLLILCIFFPFFSSFLFLPKFLYRRFTITIDKRRYEIKVKKFFQIAGRAVFLREQAIDYGGCDVEVTTNEPKNNQRLVIIINTYHGSSVKEKIQIPYFYNLKNLLEHIFSTSQLEPNNQIHDHDAGSTATSEYKENYSLSITARLSAIDPKRNIILQENNQLVSINNVHSDSDKNDELFMLDLIVTFIGHSFNICLGLALTVVFANFVTSPTIFASLPPLFFGLIILILGSIILIFNGVHSILSQLVNKVMYQTVRFDRAGQVIILEEKFMIYTSSTKYFWDSAEMTIEKPQDVEQYITGKQALCLTLQKFGQPAKRVELSKATDDRLLIELREYILQFKNGL